MARNIALFSDGTGNSSGKLFRTNVWRLYQSLDLSRPADQIAYYDDGVGTSAFKPLAILGGAFGWGLKRNVIDLYTFLCRNYEPGDRIFGIGFSRGAFTIRVLAGFVNNQGLVYSASEAELRRLALEAFRSYRAERYKSVFRLEIAGRAARDAVLALRDRALGRPSYAAYRGLHPKDDVPIHFLGLWDTVAAYGLPIDELTRAWNAFFPLTTPDRDLSANTLRACHALALDDERNTFHPVLWNERGLPRRNHIHEERLTQVWFAGMHSSLGGGYPDDALAHVSLDWMMGEAARAGMIFKAGERTKVRAAADPAGPLYDSRHGLGGSYRYLPRKLSVLTRDTVHRDNEVVIARPKIHHTVLDRIAKGVDGYAPIVLPGRYAVVTAAGAILDEPPEPVPPPPCCWEHRSQARARARRQEEVYNIVWAKRVAYFTSIAFVSALAAFPLLWPATDACEGSACAISPLLGAAGALVPGFLDPWIKAYKSHPATFSVLLGVVVALVWTGSFLQIRVFDAMRRLWTTIRAAPGQATARARFPSDLLYRFRTYPAYQRFFCIMKRVILPAIFGAAAAWVLFAILAQSLFNMASSAGFVCRPSERTRLVKDHLPAGAFRNDALCWAAGVELAQGRRYRITMRIDDRNAWTDGGIRSGAGGFGVEAMTAVMYPGILLRRHLGERWFKPIVRIGSQGTDEYPLYPIDWTLPGREDESLVAEITARRSGELFLFVNDAVLPAPRALQLFYRNNRGTATVRVDLIPPAQ